MVLRLVLLGLIAFAEHDSRLAFPQGLAGFVSDEGPQESALASLNSSAVAEAAPAANLQTPKPEQKEITVYATRTGKKYHREGCRYLSRSQIPMSLTEAAVRYGPCSVCRPPIPKSAADTKAAPDTPAPAVSSSPKAPDRPVSAVASGRCQATTKKGTQCSRNAKAGSRYCWQHGG